MLKMKTCFTVFAVYEILAVIVVHMTRVCTAMFGANFCADGGFKYFIACVAIPVLAFLIWMWVSEIIHVVHRRHSIVYRTKSAIGDMMHDVKERVSDSFTKQDIEKYITAAALFGIKKYTDSHPETRRMVEEIVAAARGQHAPTARHDADYDADDEDEEYQDAEYHTRRTTRTDYHHPIKKARKKK